MKKISMAALLLGLGSTTVHAQANDMRGSDTLYTTMNRAVTGLVPQLEAAGSITPGDINYIGTGSSNGQADIVSGKQELAPMSRFLNTTGCAASPSTAGCWQIGLDGLAVASDNTEDTTCDVLRFTGTLAVTDVNGDGLSCPECTNVTASTGDYTFSDWRDVLRIIYGGQHKHIAGSVCDQNLPARSSIADKICGSDVRRTLVNTWSNMFEGGCSDPECSQLLHAWRRDDASGTTDTFLELLALPAITATPYCNGPDAGTGGNPTNADQDPIRRNCTTNEQLCTGTGANAGTNGLVLPIKSPLDTDPYFSTVDSCSATTFSAGAFGDVQVTTFPPPAACPNGAALIAGTCKLPKKEGTGTAPVGYNCLAHAGNDPPGTVGPATFDARTYNMTPRAANGLPITTAVATAFRNSPWYRIHSTRVNAGSSSAPCRELDATDDIGCLVEASPCTIGFAGASAVGDAASPDPYPFRKGLGLRQQGGVNPVFPTSAEIQDVCATRYTLTRGLWMCTIDDFANTGTQVASFVAAQQQLKSLIMNTTARDSAITGAGFLTVPGPTTFTPCP